jgi:2-keto-4-pentenoate hydratase/2-oxohepta-3-ene-1,7-dioic acid hydratase in catechol pathway
MRFLRFLTPSGESRQGWTLKDFVGLVEGSIYGEFQRKELELPLESVHLQSPLRPEKIICVGRNYADHAREHDAEVPEVPLLFLKPPSAVIGPDQPIILPPQSNRVEHEAELAVVISRQGRWISTQEAMDYVFGYTIANDVTARDLQWRDGQWTRGKGFDTFCPLGPWIETEFDPADALITCHVNGEMRQMASTRDMVFSIQKLIAFASSVMTLQPGDILMTGTPAGVGQLTHGDVVEISIEGIGILRNPVTSETIS